MKKALLLIIMIIAFIFIGSVANTDQASEKFVKALKKGNYIKSYKAKSLLTPPYCYDLNRWHGVKFIKAVNGRMVKPSYPFTYQDMTHLKVRKLRERAGIDKMVDRSRDDLELIRQISDWANMQWGHMQPLPYASWDAHKILDRVETGDAFWCTYKAALFIQGCNAAGLTARILGINPRDNAAHTVTEVYNNDFRKWMIVDPWLNLYFERDGVPLSARELHDSAGNIKGIYLIFGKNGRGTEYWDFKTGKAETIPHAGKRIPIEEDKDKGLYHMYFDIRIVLRNDHTVHPQSTENVYVDGFMVPYNARGGEWWGPQLKWIDDNTPPQVTCDNTAEVDDFEWPLNEVKVDLRKISVQGEPFVMKAAFSTLTPNFNHYLLEIDGETVPVDSDMFIWNLKEGINSLKVSSINDCGRRGFPSEFVIKYDPSLNDYSQKVAVKVENPGFENIDSKSKKDRAPAHWRTIRSNALGFKDFHIDSKVKHSGKYSLKATPEKDSETGIEYAFIVRSENLAVNPATDVVYSIWLRASKDNTPVDIALFEAKYKGLGTYVERVIVGKSWKKYDLKCRLHNEITLIYAGFKVYSGTVWADDAHIEEIE